MIITKIPNAKRSLNLPPIRSYFSDILSYPESVVAGTGR